MSLVLDFSFEKPKVSAILEAGAVGVARYFSWDNRKNLTPKEATEDIVAGLGIVTVWESTADRALTGAPGGIQDARQAVILARACAMPAGRPIYFAVDFDADPAEQYAINQYLSGAASVLGRDHVGIYGGYWVVSRALDARVVAWAWQTVAWSGGHVDARAGLLQTGDKLTVGGIQCDVNKTELADYGQWNINQAGYLRFNGFQQIVIGAKDPYITGDPVDWHCPVQCAQNALNVIGGHEAKADAARLDPDGIFGSATQSVVLHFQTVNGLTVDGVIGAHTWAMLAQRLTERGR